MNAKKKGNKNINQAMFKIVIIGDSGSGKSCLLVRYTKEQFSADYNVTVGVEFAAKTIEVDENHRIKLQLWDTAGQQNYQSIVKSFYKNSSAIILAYNITNKRSFDSISNWLHQSRENAGQDTLFVLMGTHLDLQSERQVKKQQAEEFVRRENIALFFETSSKTSVNVNRAFDQVAKQLFINQLQKKKMNSEETKPITLQVQEPRKNICC